MAKREDLEGFAEWVAEYIFEDDWELNSDAFAELACRRLHKLGIVAKADGKWIYTREAESNGG